MYGSGFRDTLDSRKTCKVFGPCEINSWVLVTLLHNGSLQAPVGCDHLWGLLHTKPPKPRGPSKYTPPLDQC